MPVARKPPAATDPESVPVVDSDSVLASILGALHQPLVHHVADCLTIDRMPTAPGLTPVPTAERARSCADVAISDVAHALRQAGYAPTRGERLVRQHAVRLAERVLRKYLLSLEVGADSVDTAVGLLHDEEASRDRFAAAAQSSAAREPIDPPPLEPLPTKENPRDRLTR